MYPSTDDASNQVSLLTFLTERWLNLLLLAGPLSWLIYWPHWSETWLFVVSAIAIVPLAGLVGQATEQLANRMGPRLQPSLLSGYYLPDSVFASGSAAGRASCIPLGHKTYLGFGGT